MNLDPEDILADPEARDILIACLNAVDGRIDTKLRAASVVELAGNLLFGQQGTKEHAAWIGCTVGLLIRIADDAPGEAAQVIDAFREAVRDAALRS